ncbi:hypothetical protein DSI35_11815 [Mycobacterium tuberculosis]|uniref:Uncharacterized protein n=6 Tax=Mycobacterium tuberculosis complex TaxID=77643 RepID=A0A087MXH9_MYCTX|nr:hypothetical protein CCDC5079_0579 [Mycobacterium tuberculosis CCDC5079]AFE11935.1 hypothetical protein MRGA423_03865 [Mycobacterium tuberculosis RGTB423]AFE15589.1 hypothetical protein MRGA327_03890 [Mycobacterium tuberculosis RGTB327]AGJ66637.1 hypothetical protein J112_03320 [Mycobacterium tuberculosis str. Beijing/NITR203]AGL22376.1 hypothetical protein I917_04425 [Mycobacterium tuberculosis str. Haarlem/NITR202]AGL26102.1 hypothetical protein J113_04420 [Mycobacterium tuberculosis CAS/
MLCMVIRTRSHIRRTGVSASIACHRLHLEAKATPAVGQTQERSSWGGIGSRAKPRSKAASSWPRDTAATTNTRAQDQSAILVTRLLERLGALAPGRMRQTDHALALVLGISEAG